MENKLDKKPAQPKLQEPNGGAMLTLSQYYDQYVKSIGHRSWNHFCAEMKRKGLNYDGLKKQLNREYKTLKKEKNHAT